MLSGVSFPKQFPHTCKYMSVFVKDVRGTLQNSRAFSVQLLPASLCLPHSEHIDLPGFLNSARLPVLLGSAGPELWLETGF